MPKDELDSFCKEEMLDNEDGGMAQWGGKLNIYDVIYRLRLLFRCIYISLSYTNEHELGFNFVHTDDVEKYTKSDRFMAELPHSWNHQINRTIAVSNDSAVSE